MKRYKNIKSILLICIAIVLLLIISYYQFEVECKRNSSNLFKITSVVLSAIAIVGSIYIYTRKQISEEKVFLYVVPLMAIIMMIFMPLGRAHDELRHFTRSYEVSRGGFLSQVIDGEVQSELPIAVSKLYNDVGWRKITYNDIKDNITKEINKDDTIKTEMKYTAVYSPIQYLPQAVGIFMADLVTDNVFVLAYSARVFNMILALVLLYFSIKIIPFGKKLILILSMIPIVLEGICSMSPDALTISISILFIAYILKIIYNKEESKMGFKEKFILLMMALVIALCKIVYLPIVGMILLIPKERYKSNKDKMFYIALVFVLAIVLSLGWFVIANNYLSISSEGNSGGKIISIIKNPLQFIQELFYSMNYYGQKYMFTLFGSELAWNENAKTYFIVPFIYFLLFLQEAIASKENKRKFTLFQYVIMLLVVIAVIGLIFTSLYIQWTSNTSKVIEGVQGRYFIPIMLIIAMLLSLINIESNYSEQARTKLIGIVGLVSQIYVILSVIIVHL